MIIAPNIDELKLKSFLSEQYDFDVLSIIFLPKGESSWIYIIETNKGKYLLKLYAVMLPFLEEAAELTYKLYSVCGIIQIVHAINAKNKKTVNIFENYPIVLFNFIEGNEILEQRLTDQQIEEVGKIIGKIHVATSTIREYPKKETFESKDKEIFLKVIKRIKAHLSSDSGYHKQLVDLLLPRKERIMQEFTKLEEIGNRLKAKNLPFVICHSDPTPGNILIGNNGELYIIDWDTPILAPKERDLFFFQDRQNLFMKGYVSVAGEVTLDQDALEFYRREWNVQEVADFGDTILFQNKSKEQNEHTIARVKEFLDYSGIGDAS